MYIVKVQIILFYKESKIKNQKLQKLQNNKFNHGVLKD